MCLCRLECAILQIYELAKATLSMPRAMPGLIGESVGKTLPHSWLRVTAGLLAHWLPCEGQSWGLKRTKTLSKLDLQVSAAGVTGGSTMRMVEVTKPPLSKLNSQRDTSMNGR